MSSNGWICYMNTGNVEWIYDLKETEELGKNYLKFEYVCVNARVCL